MTGGNPFFVTQLLESETLAVPASVRDPVLTRISQLSPEGRELAEIAAITPAGTAFWLIARIFSQSASALDASVNQGVLDTNQDGLVYRYELAHRAVEDSLAPGRVRQLHSMVLHALLDQFLETPPLAYGEPGLKRGNRGCHERRKQVCPEDHHTWHIPVYVHRAVE